MPFTPYVSGSLGQEPRFCPSGLWQGQSQGSWGLPQVLRRRERAKGCVGAARHGESFFLLAALGLGQVMCLGRGLWSVAQPVQSVG